jgi:hypothetical protein
MGCRFCVVVDLMDRPGREGDCNFYYFVGMGLWLIDVTCSRYRTRKRSQSQIVSHGAFDSDVVASRGLRPFISDQSVPWRGERS